MASYFQKTQNYLQQYYSLTDYDVKRLRSQLPTTDVYQYIGHKAEILNKSIDPLMSNRLQQKKYDNNFWQQSYDKIKADSWPPCSSVEDFYNLPIEIQQECESVHNFSPEIWFNQNLSFESFTKSNEWNYEIIDLIKLKNLVLDNLDIIQDKNVIDFSTHTGATSGVCLYHNAKHVVFTEIREPFLELAQERMHLMGFDRDRYTAKLSDIHNYQTNTKLCHDQDTVILSGIIYHLHDHFSVLESITKANPKSIIIETCHYKKIAEVEEPLIYYMAEETEKNTCNAWHDNLPLAIVGFPNLSWLNMTLEFFRYKETKRVLYDSWMPNDDILEIKKPTILRSVQVFELKHGS